MSTVADHYDTTYSRFTSELNAEMRRDVYGEDIGQHSWVTAEEQISFAKKSGLGSNSHLLEVGCGSGGPAVFLARTLGLTVTGIDINEAGIATAKATLARPAWLIAANFVRHDGGETFPFADQSFDAIQSIDAVNHIPDRKALLTELHRLLRPGGTLLYTDPVIVTGPVNSEEIAVRSSIGFFIFMPPGENERLLQECGFDLVSAEDVTANIATDFGAMARGPRKEERCADRGRGNRDLRAIGKILTHHHRPIEQSQAFALHVSGTPTVKERSFRTTRGEIRRGPDSRERRPRPPRRQ